MGDAERLLAQLRPLRAERLATSVWLQLSDSPPLTGEALETLIEREVELQKVLAPVRQWRFHASTLREQYQPKVLDAQTPAPRVKRKSNLLSDDKSDAGTNSSDRELPPIELVDSGELGYAVNLFLSDTPSAGKWRKLQKTVMEWGNLGVSHGFGDGFLHEVGDISHEGNVVRFRIDWGSASPIIAIAYLVEQLHSVDDTQIVRVVLGEQTIN